MQTPTRRAPWLLLLLAAALLLQFAWRTYLAAQFALATSVPGRALTLLQWQHIDQFLGPTALILLAFAEYLHARNPLKPFWIFLGILLALILAAISFTLAFPGTDPAVEITIAVLLALAVLLLGPRSLFVLSRDVAHRGGFTIDLLWRLLTLQWLLVWVAAEFILRLTLRNTGGIPSSDRARNLLFALPAYALLPNILLSAGLHWLNPQRLQNVRIRAWLVSLLALNAAAVMLLLGEFANRWWTVAALPPFLLALALYPTGFPRGTWGGWKTPAPRLTLLAFAALFLGLLLAAIEHARAPDQPSLLREYAAAWRFLAGPAFLLLFLLAPAHLWLNSIPEKYRGGKVRTAATLLIVIGALATPACFLASLLNRNAVAFSALTTLLLWIGLLLAAAVTLRAWRSP
jgi:hypothetical protein